MSALRVLIVFDGDAWFVRRLRAIEHDLDRDEKVYHCDQHLAGPCATLESACHAANHIIEQGKKPAIRKAKGE